MPSLSDFAEIVIGVDTHRDSHTAAVVDTVNRPGVSGDSDCWEGWSHGREYDEAVSG